MNSISIKDGEIQQIGQDVIDIRTGPTRYIRIINELETGPNFSAALTSH